MAISSETALVSYAGNGSTSTAYVVSFYFLDNDDLTVVLKDADGNEETLTETTDYTLTGAGNTAGGSLTTAVAYDSTYTLVIFRDAELLQPTDYEAQGSFPASSHERALDRLVMYCQQQQREIDQSFKVSPASDFPTEINLSASEDTVMGFDSAGAFSLRTASQLRDFIAITGSIETQVTASWADNTARASKVPDFDNQLGVQDDDRSLWISTGTSAGNWELFPLDEDTMTSDSARRPATQQSVKAFVETSVAAAMPTGSLTAYAGATAPTGWLLCYGQAVSRTTYADLFAVVSTTYGVGDGSTTFNLPDLRGRVAAGKDDMGGSAASRLTNSGTGNPGVDGATLGASGGVDRHTLTEAQLAAHTHTVNNGTTIWSEQATTSGVFAGGSGQVKRTTTITNASTGGGEAHPNQPPTLVLNYLIKT